MTFQFASYNLLSMDLHFIHCAVLMTHFFKKKPQQIAEKNNLCLQSLKILEAHPIVKLIRK